MEDNKPNGVASNQVVAWGDMDAYGHVNNVQYLRYFESARVKYFDALLGNFSDLPPDSGIPVVANISCNYKRPVVYPDTLSMQTRTKSLGKASLVMECEMHSANGFLAAVAECVIVFIDKKSGRPKAINDLIRKEIELLEGVVY